MANAEKTAVVEELTGKFRESSGAVLTEYRGLTVAQMKELRGSLGGNATFAVVKNTLTKIAATEAGVGDELAPMLSGPSAIAFVSGDVAQAAKGRYLKKITFTTTMAPGIPVDPNKTRGFFDEETVSA